MKDQLCRAFCETVSVREVPAGLAVSTTVASLHGDPIGFYVVGPLLDGRYRLEDSGLLVPYLQAIGADLDNDTRRETFMNLLEEHHASFDDETFEIVSESVVMTDVPAASLRFVTLLLRVGDLSFTTQERVASTFKSDVAARIRDAVAGRAVIREGEPLSGEVPDWEPDLILEAENRDPVAVFLVQTDARILEALMLQAEALQRNVPASVIALLERENSVSKRTGLKARNRLETVPVYEGGQVDAIARIAREAIGRNSTVH